MEIEVKRLARSIRLFWWLPIALALVLGLLSALGGSTLPKSYTASAQLLVVPQAPGSQAVVDSGSYVNFVKLSPVLDQVIDKLDLEMTRDQLDSKLKVSKVPGTQIIQIEITMDDPQKAVDIVNATADSFVAQVSQLTIGDLRSKQSEAQRQSDSIRDQIVVINARLAEIDIPENEEDRQVQGEIATLKSDRLRLSQTQADLDSTIRTLNTQLASTSVPVTVIHTAEVPDDPEGVSPILLGMVGAVLGAMVGGALLIFWAIRDDTVYDVADVETAIQAPARLLATPKQSATALGLAKARLVALSGARENVVLVSPRSVGSNLQLPIEEAHFPLADGLLESPEAVQVVHGKQAAYILSRVNKTSATDLADTAEALRDMGIEIVGGIAYE